jgi:hypothetical protein
LAGPEAVFGGWNRLVFAHIVYPCSLPCLQG